MSRWVDVRSCGGGHGVACSTTGTVLSALLVSGLSVAVLTIAILQTVVVAVLGVTGDQLGVSTVAVSWAVTANLLAAIAATDTDRDRANRRQAVDPEALAQSRGVNHEWR